MERAAMDRIQQMIDDEVEKRFREGAVPRLVLLQHGDDPVVEPGELYLRVLLGKDYATSVDAVDAWLDEHVDRLEEFRAERLPEVRGFVVTIDDPETIDGPPVRIMQMEGSPIDPEEHEIARGLTPVMARLGRVDLETLDALITAGIAANRAEAVRWALGRIRERPAYGKLSERARELEDLKAQF
jgi:hypothetical protein